jgi:hypothetical protein
MSYLGVSVRLRGPCLGLCVLAALAGCLVDNKEYCETEGTPCKEGAGICRSNKCTASDAATGTGGRGGSGGKGGSGGAGGAPIDAGKETIGMSDIDATVEVPNRDALIPADVSGDAKGCATPDDCPPGMKLCVMSPAGGVCVSCVPPAPGALTPLYCDQNTKPYCEEYQCKGCHELAASPCNGATPKCNGQTGLCAECLTSADCADMARPICTAGKCTGCTTGTECAAKDPNNPACKAGGTCVGCSARSDCKPPTQACEMNKCVPCTTDAQCIDGMSPGLCLTDPDGKAGRCATDEESIFVGAGPGCSDTGKGATGMPFCSPQKAIGAVTATRRVIVIRGGGTAFDPMVVNPAGGNLPLYIVGTNDAVIAPGKAEAGLLVNQSVDVRVRSLTIRGGEQFGVRATGSAIIRLNRCLIINNRQGGLDVTTGAGYDVANCVFEANGANGPTAGAIGAARLGTPNMPRPARFRSSTLIDNVNGGVTCQDSMAVLTGLLLKGNDVNSGCAVVESCMGDPMFSPTRPYHLLDGSPARNKVNTGSAPWDDIDGEPRADASGKTDCGADDFK